MNDKTENLHILELIVKWEEMGISFPYITFGSLQRGCLSLYAGLIHEKHPHGELK